MLCHFFHPPSNLSRACSFQLPNDIRMLMHSSCIHSVHCAAQHDEKSFMLHYESSFFLMNDVHISTLSSSNITQ